MPSSCTCFCCQGINCVTTLIGSINAQVASQCVAASCTSAFPGPCMKNLASPGKITTQFNSSPNNGNNGNTGNRAGTRGSSFSFTSLIIVIVILALIIGCCVMACRRNSKPTYSQPPMYNTPPTYQQPGYGYGQPAYAPAPQQSSGVNPALAGAGGLAAGLVGGALLNNALSGGGRHHHHHGGGYNSGGYNNNTATHYENSTTSYTPFGTEQQTTTYNNDGFGNINQTTTDSW
ncbi:hypothetical protein BC833DRAFT_655849 [Globomyces pollinis-pini]|nr:hypothetical protein BC833DRAFT_655849 [Globomyces pollinis-pini]